MPTFSNPLPLIICILCLSLLNACSYAPHDNDTLYMHGFIAPLDEVDSATYPLTITLSNGETVISTVDIKPGGNFPTAYKLEFHPPQLNDDNSVLLRLEQEQKGKKTLLYQREIQLTDLDLFSTKKNIIFSSSAVFDENNMSENDEKLYQHFECEDQTLIAKIKPFYILLKDGEKIVPKIVRSPPPIYAVDRLFIKFYEDKFTIEKNGEVTNCHVNSNGYQPFQATQETLKKIKSDKK